jgi:hypothetical protein
MGKTVSSRFSVDLLPQAICGIFLHDHCYAQNIPSSKTTKEHLTKKSLNQYLTTFFQQYEPAPTADRQDNRQGSRPEREVKKPPVAKDNPDLFLRTTGRTAKKTLMRL